MLFVIFASRKINKHWLKSKAGGNRKDIHLFVWIYVCINAKIYISMNMRNMSHVEVMKGMNFLKNNNNAAVFSYKRNSLA